MSKLFINHHYKKGFSLIELAVVLFIVGLMLGGLLTPLATKVEYENINETSIALNEIKESLLGFAIANGYLPCPDTNNDGSEDLVTKPVTGAPGLSCSSEIGELPWITLGVSATDAWENNYTYRVDDEFADRADSANTDGKSTDTCTATANISFSLCERPVIFTSEITIKVFFFSARLRFCRNAFPILS